MCSECERGYLSKRTWQDNQGLISGLQQIISICSLLIPSSTPHYEVAIESVYTVGRLLGFVNNSILDSTDSDFNSVEPWLRFFTHGLSHTEVLLEKIAESFVGLPLGIGIPNRYSVLFSIESAKSICRLVMLVERRKTTMLVNWAKDPYHIQVGKYDDDDGGNSSGNRGATARVGEGEGAKGLDIEHYQQYYFKFYHRTTSRCLSLLCESDREIQNSSKENQVNFHASPIRRRKDEPNSEPNIHPYTPTTALSLVSTSDVISNQKVNEIAFTGRRSGLKVKLDTTVFDTLPSSNPSYANTCSSSNTNNDTDNDTDADTNGVAESYQSIPFPSTSQRMIHHDKNEMKSHYKNDDNEKLNKLYREHNEINTLLNVLPAPELVGECHERVTVSNPISNDSTDTNTGLFVGIPSAVLDTSPPRIEICDRDDNSKNNKVVEVCKDRDSDEDESRENGEINSLTEREKTLQSSSNTASKASSVLPSLPSTIGQLTPSQALVLGEVLYILRPTLYTWVLKYIHETEEHSSFLSASASKSWWSRMKNATPAHTFALLISLVIELTSISITQSALHACRQNAKKNAKSLQIYDILRMKMNSMQTRRDNSTLTSSSEMMNMEADRHTREIYEDLSSPSVTALTHPYDIELRRRKIALLYYLLRSPLFDVTTRPILENISHMIKFIPLIGSIPEYVLGVMKYLNSSHFYNSASS